MRFSFRDKILMLSAAILCASCSDTDASLPELEQFAHTYSNVLYEREKGGDSVEILRRVDSVLNAYGYTEAEFKDKFNTYAKNPQSMRILFDSAQAMAARHAAAIKH